MEGTLVNPYTDQMEFTTLLVRNINNDQRQLKFPSNDSYFSRFI